MGPDTLVRLAGFASAHALASMADGEHLVPFLLTEDATSAKSLQRFAVGPKEAQDLVLPMLAQGIDGNDRGVLAVSGARRTEAGATTIMVVDGADWRIPVELTFRFQLNPATDTAPLGLQGIDIDDVEPGSDEHRWVLETMASGMAAHPDGAPWVEALRRLN